jgi:hypothetical protein
VFNSNLSMNRSIFHPAVELCGIHASQRQTALGSIIF